MFCVNLLNIKKDLNLNFFKNPADENFPHFNLKFVQDSIFPVAPDVALYERRSTELLKPLGCNATEIEMTEI